MLQDPVEFYGGREALICTALQLRQLSPDAQAHLNEAILGGAGHVELRTRIDGGRVELVLVPADGSEPLWLTRMVQRGDG